MEFFRSLLLLWKRKNIHRRKRLAIQDDFDQRRSERIKQGRFTGLSSIEIRNVQIHRAKVRRCALREIRTISLVADQIGPRLSYDASDQAFPFNLSLQRIKPYMKAAIAIVGGIGMHILFKIG